MSCLICKHPTQYFFHKDFNKYGLGRVEYHKCHNCGLVHSETHRLLSENAWLELNHTYHDGYQGSDMNTDDPRWLERLQSQAHVLADAVDLGLIAKDGDWLDYACGDGKLTEFLKSKKNLLKYDKYMNKSDYLDASELVSGRFDFLITTSVLEHLLQRKHFDAIHTLISQQGVMGLHTLVCEQVPCDPNWFYLLPVHCVFHTNKSMSILLEQWGYIESIYNVEARLWLLFKPNTLNIEHVVEHANKRENSPSYIYKKGFVDYWK